MTWSLPDLPGPEVTAMRDRFGVRWLRQGDEWWSKQPGLGTLRSWAQLLARGPLTNASGEKLVSDYDNDPRVRPHPDGSWMVFSDDYRTEYCVAQHRDGEWNSFDASGRLLAEASNKARKDDAIRALIGDPR